MFWSNYLEFKLTSWRITRKISPINNNGPPGYSMSNRFAVFDYSYYGIDAFKIDTVSTLKRKRPANVLTGEKETIRGFVEFGEVSDSGLSRIAGVM